MADFKIHDLTVLLQPGWADQTVGQPPTRYPVSLDPGLCGGSNKPDLCGGSNKICQASQLVVDIACGGTPRIRAAVGRRGGRADGIRNDRCAVRSTQEDPNQEDPNEVVVGEGAVGGRSGKLPSYLAVTWRSSPVISLLPIRAASVAAPVRSRGACKRN